MFPFPAVRYRLEFIVESPLQLPEYAGSMLRGVFGIALRQLACMVRQPVCEGCSLLRTCPYALIFESPPAAEHVLQKFSHTPNPYVIEPPPWGERLYQPGESLHFHLVLIGRARAQLALILLAWQRALAQGVGPRNGRARLSDIVLESEEGEFPLLDPVTGILREHPAEIIAPAFSVGETVTLELRTPTRLQRNGSPLGPTKITPRDFLMTLTRRVSLLAEFHGDAAPGFDFAALEAIAHTITAEGKLDWRDWNRWSNRQRQEMTLGGVVGPWTLHGELAPFWPMLYLGQWLHVGKNATFGLGGYRLVDGSITTT